MSWDNGLEPWLCGRLVGWVRARPYLRTVLRETPSWRAISRAEAPGSCLATGCRRGCRGRDRQVLQLLQVTGLQLGRGGKLRLDLLVVGRD